MNDKLYDEGLSIVEIDTPIGSIKVAANSDQLKYVWLPNHSEIIKTDNIKRMNCYSHLEEAVDFIERYFQGEHASWAGRFIPPGTSFMQQVWEAVSRIPFGETLSYGDLAALCGRPAAARAVGTAMARNPLPILIPCHRVIASNGSLGGYGGGLDLKRWLLRHEGIELL